jgi:hypothetical protein
MPMPLSALAHSKLDSRSSALRKIGPPSRPPQPSVGLTLDDWVLDLSGGPQKPALVMRAEAYTELLQCYNIRSMNAISIERLAELERREREAAIPGRQVSAVVDLYAQLSALDARWAMWRRAGG